MDKLVSMVDEAVLFLVIETRGEDVQLVGTTSIVMSHPKNRDGIFGIMLEPQFWGKGYGEEVTRFVVDYCFHSLGLHRVSLSVFDGNVRAKKLYKKV